MSLERFIRMIALFFTLLGCGVSLAQDKSLFELASEMMTEEKSHFWLIEYQGIADGIHLIDMVLITDNKVVQGVYQYSSSGDVFWLYGYQQGEKLILSEYDESGRMTGTLEGEFEDVNLHFLWSDKEKLNLLSLVVFPSNSKKNLQSVYEGCQSFSFKQDKRNGQLIKISNESHTYFVLLWSDFEDDVVLKAFEKDSQIYSASKKPGKLNAFYQYDDSKKLLKLGDETIAMDSRNSISASYQISEYIAFDTRFVTIVPRLNHKKFDAYVENLIEPYLNISKRELENRRNKDTDFSADQRLSNGSFIIGKVEYLSTHFISGYFMIHCGFSHVFKIIPFNYNLHKSREMSSDEILAEIKNADTEIQKAYRNKNEEGIIEKEVFNWCKNQNIAKLFFKGNALSAHAEAHPVFGDCSVELNFETIAHKFSENLKKLLIP
jgi:hypothetical protein